MSELSSQKEGFNNNDRQRNFNQVKGVIAEFLAGDKFGSVTLELGHEKKRFVNLVIKQFKYEETIAPFKVGDKVSVKFYITSKQNDKGHWSTMATILEIDLCK